MSDATGAAVDKSVQVKLVLLGEIKLYSGVESSAASLLGLGVASSLRQSTVPDYSNSLF